MNNGTKVINKVLKAGFFKLPTQAHSLLNQVWPKFLVSSLPTLHFKRYFHSICWHLSLRLL